MSFKGKVAVVTGAGAGIGLATVLGLAEKGARVGIVDVDAQAGNTAVQQCQPFGSQALFLDCNVAVPADVDKMVAKILTEWGRIDILVNNAGIYIQGDVTMTAPADWEKIMAVNLTGAFLCTRAVVPIMIQQGGGVIVNVGSEAGLVGIGNQVAYNVSKGGVIALTRSCAVDFAPHGVRVNCVCPGTTETPLVQAAVLRSADPIAARRKLEQVRPLNRLGKPEEIASAIVYMASDEAGYATGSILSIDGGYTTQ
jgi:NAD(P)-dependent dehydrogenase (short-subunit alcohol dehydrogenase family)